MEATVDIQSALRSLVHHVNSCTPEATLHDVDGQTRIFLLDVEAEGVRCVLIRREPPEDRVQLTLSPREREIARLVAKGHPNKTIAAVLDISSWTVSTYLRRIFAKLGVGTRAAMVARLSEIKQLAVNSTSHA
jgi:DNA-binding CsgD family transcriptional regulator